MSEEVQTPNERDMLKQKADLLGLDYASNISTDKLRKLVNDINDPKPEVETDTRSEPTKDVSKAPEKALTDEEKVRYTIETQRLELTKLRRVIISCMDPQMKEHETTPPLSFSNAIITLPKIVVPLHVEWYVPQGYLDQLSDQMCTIATKGKDAKGRKVTKPKQIKRYNIQYLPDLTVDEIEDIKKMQLARTNTED